MHSCQFQIGTDMIKSCSLLCNNDQKFQPLIFASITLTGFEIDDPLLRCWSNSNETDGNDLDPTIIYARVIEEVEDEETQAGQYPFFRKRYKIEVYLSTLVDHEG